METLEAVLKKLLVADHNVIKQATEELRELLRGPSCLAQLCAIVAQSQDVQVRQYACVLLRKRLLKARHWKQLDTAFQNSLKEDILKVLSAERERPVKNAIAQLVGCVARHELARDGWPTLLSFLSDTMLSNNALNQELGVYTLSIVSESCTEQLQPHLSRLLSVFSQLLLVDSCNIHHYVIQTLVNLTVVMGSEQLTAYQSLIPIVLASTGRVAVEAAVSCEAEQYTLSALALIDELADHEMALLSPHVAATVQLLLQLAAPPGGSEANQQVQIKALHCVEHLCRTKKCLLKRNLVEPVLNTVVPLLSAQTEDDDDDVLDDDEDQLNETSSSILVACTRLIDAMAINMPPEKILNPLLRLVEPLLAGEDVFGRRAAFLALAMTAEGCSERIRRRLLPGWLQHVCAGVQHSHHVVRHAALFTLAQLAEYLQPDIGRHADQVMPVLLAYLATIVQNTAQSGNNDLSDSGRVFYALEIMCESLSDDIAGYADPLLQHLLQMLQLVQQRADTLQDQQKRSRLTVMAVSALGVVMAAAGDCSAPTGSGEKLVTGYLPGVMLALRGFLVGGQQVGGGDPQQQQQQQQLQMQALETVGVLVKSLDSSIMAPFVHELIMVAVSLVETHEHDPDLRRVAYGLFAAVSRVLPAPQLQPYMPRITSWLVESLDSTESMQLQHRGNGDCDGAVLDVFDELTGDSVSLDDDDDDDDDEKEGVVGYTIENSYLAEKEDALIALRELAEFSAESLAPHTTVCFEATHRLLIHSHEDVRKAAVDALAQLCVSVRNLDNMQHALDEMLSVLVSRLHELVDTDDSCCVAAAALDAYSLLLKQLGPSVFSQHSASDSLTNSTCPHLQDILDTVKSVINGQTQCQQQSDGWTEDGGGGEQSEYDEMLVQYAYDVVPALGHALTGGAQFLHVFTQVLPALLDKTRKSRSDMDRSFSVGCLAECLEHLDQTTVQQLLPQLLPIFIECAADRDADDVQSNAVFGLGELVYRAGGEASRAQFAAILSSLSSALSSTSSRCTRDNVCGAVARLIITDVSAVPMKQVFPVFVSCLPLREDYAENRSVFRCLLHLYSGGLECREFLLQHLSPLVSCAATVLNTKQEKEADTAQLVREFLLNLRRDYPDQMTSVLASLSSGLANKLATLQL